MQLLEYTNMDIQYIMKKDKTLLINFYSALGYIKNNEKKTIKE